MTDVGVRLGPLHLRSPLIAASGTVGSVYDFTGVGRLDLYGAAVAKSVSGDPWQGRVPPRLAPAGVGMLNGIGIQNPGIDAWVDEVGGRIDRLPVPVWGSAVGTTASEFARVAKGLAAVGVAAVEINLSCPNLEGEKMFALDAEAAAGVVDTVVRSVDVPVGAKLSPNAEDIVAVASAVAAAGASWVVLTNTAWGAGFDIETRRPALSGIVGGYSGPPLKPIALRCVWQVSQALPELPIVGCGGVATGSDVIEYLMAGASAVAVGTAHFAEPRVGARIMREVHDYCRRHDVRRLTDLTGTIVPW